jgi:hypothetical protein
VWFGQLAGMAEGLSFGLAHAGQVSLTHTFLSACFDF